MENQNWFMRHKVLSAVIGIFILISVVNTVRSGGKGVEVSPTPTVANTNSVVMTPKVVAVFDLETLKEKNIDEIRTMLGKPTDSQVDPTADQVKGATEWYNSFEKDGYELLVTFNTTNRKVTDFFVSTDSPAGQDIEKLKQVLNVVNSSSYTVEPVKALQNPSTYTGIKVTPKV